MTLHDTRSANTSRTSKGSSTTSSSEQNDIKKLKSKYSAKLPTLKVLFADWSDEDLLFVLEEANGDLDLTIDRISEGHASQWGEVKTKKSKKEAQKAKAATTGVSTHNQQSTITPPPATSYRDTRPSQARSYNDRPSRPGKASSSTSRTRPSKSNTVQSASWDSQPKQTHINNDISGGSWASIASLKQANDNANDSWNTTATNNDIADEWGAPLSSTDNTSNNNTLSPPADETGDDQPKTWASLLKSKPKTEPEPTTTSNATTTDNAFSETNTATNNTVSSEWDAPNTSSSNDNWNTDTTKATKETDEWSTPVHETAPVEPAPTTATTTAPTQEESSWDSEEQKQPEVNGWGESIPASEEKPSAATSNAPELPSAGTTASRLNQDEPAKMHENTSTAISSLDAKFGSLNVDEEQKKTEETSKESTTGPSVTDATSTQTETAAADTLAPANNTTAPSTSVPTNAAPSTEGAAPSSSATTHDTFGQTSSAYLKQHEPTATASAYNQQQQQPAAPINAAPLQNQQQPTAHQLNQQPQQQQQQLPQQFGMDHLTSAYSSYLPNQPPTGLSGFGMNPMGSLPDYGLYSTEAQRAAAMGYYDPTAFSHSPSVTSASAYGTRDKYSQDHNQTAQSQTMPQQQMYPTNLPYYQYYYMPNQYNAYQSAYGQPFMNKNMYPNNMYQQQQQPGKPSTATSGAAAATASPYAAAGTASVASPYGQQHQSQLYNHQYDDLQQLGMGLNDYQKSSMYGNSAATSQPHQLQGFLGNLNSNAAGMGGSVANASAAGSAGQAGQPQGAQQTASQASAGVAGQAGQKTGASGNASASTPHQQHQSNPHQEHHHQQQPGHQQQPYGSNYFGQPMFSYGQYPQQFQQQMPPQHQQQQSQQPTRQQQYWAQ